MPKQANFNYVQIPTLHFRDQLDGFVRVWRSDWFGDQFEVLTKEQIEIAKDVFKQFSFAVIEEFN